MEAIEKQIEAVIKKMESGDMTEEQAHIAIAEITSTIPEDDWVSDEVKGFVAEEIEKMDISEEDKQALREDLQSL